ncbi:phage tail family protein, partial [Priestia sp. OVL9]|nr:phage tail family protein [Priestia sp. OVL9]
MESNFTFRNQRRSYLTVLRGRKRPAWAPVKRNLLAVPNRPGAYHKSTDIDVRPLEVPVRIKAESIADLQKIKEDLADWLITESVEELIFDDEPDRSYFAMIDGELDLDELVNRGKGTINFICPDPYKYGLTKIQRSNNGTLTARNEGSVEALPTFEIEVDADYTNIDISNGDLMNRIGRVVNIEDYAVNREEIALSDPLSTITGWAKTVGSVHIDGLATGNMKSDGT